MVIECTCGMVMSIAAGELRRRCIRCGSVTLPAMVVGLTIGTEASRGDDQNVWRILTHADATVRSRKLLMATSADGSDI
jgi:hypothetical protein